MKVRALPRPKFTARPLDLRAFTTSANGTVTYVDGDKVYAFGHPNLTAGPTDVPMSAGYVISLLPNLQNSFKLAVPLDVAGALFADEKDAPDTADSFQFAAVP